jgi:hypothetical protein
MSLLELVFFLPALFKLELRNQAGGVVGDAFNAGYLNSGITKK